MTDGRIHMPVGTTVEFHNGDVYKIIDDPIGCGGGSILYPAQRQFMQNGVLQADNILYALKECYPAVVNRSYIRKQSGEITPACDNTEDMLYLHRTQLMQLEEASVSQNVYRTASRMLPIRGSSQSVILTLPGQSPAAVSNTVTIMDSLVEKGQSLTTWIKKQRRFSSAEAFRIIQQVLFALQEVHQAGYLHLDIQDGNVFLRGTLDQKNELVTLIDFGCARKLIEGQTAPIRDKVIFTTQGFSAPEILLHNDGSLQLGPEADIYSVGCLLLYLLTGQRANVRELIANRTGVYLRSNQLRRIQCPKHLIDMMQHVLAQALAKEPENRYHSVENMLEDVTALAEALQPKHTSLSAIKYDAFVCYKHGLVDSAAALTLQRELENYRAPKGVAEKKRPFRRVFVDEGELSSCADFGQQIREALRNSEWLIVICSPDTPLSPWVQLEIETFLEYHHDRSRILAVLTDGNPKISFPPQLQGDTSGAGEVYAAHALSSTPEEAEKQLKGDALLKIAAPMLNTTFDTLKQRHRIYQLQRISAVTAGFLVAAVAFAAYATNRANVIAEQAVRIEEEYERALINESLFLAEQAEKQLADNNPLGAMELALRALPSEKQDRPVLTEAEYVLGKALGIYKSPGATQNSAAVAGVVDTDYSEMFLDDTGKYLFIWDEYRSDIQVWDAQTLVLLNNIYIGDGVHTDAEFLIPESHHLLVRTFVGDGLWSARGIVCVDYLTGDRIWTYVPDELRVMCVSENRKILIALKSYAPNDDSHTNEVNVDILDVETGGILRQFSFNLAENHNSWHGLSQYNEICVSPDMKWLAFSVNRDLITEYSNSFDAFYLLDLETGICDLLANTDTGIFSLEFFENNLAVMRYSGDEYSYTLGGSKIYNSSRSTTWLEAYDLENKQLSWSIEKRFYPSSASLKEIKAVQYDDRKGVLYTYSNKSTLIDQITGEIIREYELRDSVVEIWYVENGFQTLDKDGTLAFLDYSEEETLSILQLVGNSITASCRTGMDFFVQNGSDSLIRKYQFAKYDDSYTHIYDAEIAEWYFGAVFADEIKNKITGVQLEKENLIRYVDVITGEIRDYAIPEEYGFSESFSSDGEKVYWNGGDRYDPIDSIPYYALDMHSGEIQEIKKPEELGQNMYIQDHLFFENTIYFIAEQYESGHKVFLVYSWNVEENDLNEIYRCTTEYSYGAFNGDIEKQELYFTLYHNYHPKQFIRIDLETSEITRISADLTIQEEGSALSADSDCFQWSNTGVQVAFVHEKTLYIVERNGEILCNIPMENEIVSVVFSPDGKYVLAFSKDGIIEKYSIGNGNCLDDIAMSQYCSTSIYLDNDDLTWTYVDGTTLLIYDSQIGGFMLDIAENSILMKAVIEQCWGYSKAMDKFLVVDANQYSGFVWSVGIFQRYSLEDLIQKANAILNK